MKTRILSADDIRSIVNHIGLNRLMDEMIRRLTDGLMVYDEKKLVIPPRSGFAYEKPDPGLLEWMPILKRGKKTTFKVVGYHPDNPAKQKLPTIVSSISIFDAANGHLEALADGTFLTALRTGAASAVASSIMGRPESAIVGLIGCGAQAVTQLHALSRVFRIDKALAYDIDPLVTRSFIRRTEFMGLDVRPSALDKLVSRSDIISTATSVRKGEGPVFKDGHVKPWLHINAVGSDFPGKIELPVSLLKRSFISPDFMDQAIVEGECQQLQASEIGVDLSTIVQNQEEYRILKNRPTVFDSTGWALEDQIALEMITERADKMGIGTRLQIESSSGDPKNPYDFIDITTRKSNDKNASDIPDHLQSVSA